ncbi:MAG: 2-phospho-L-lactate transferase [Pseudomonadota bacterium]|nr:2-phospho-L-lactate transferase [Pseudomonadota bacterium]
MAWRLTLFVLVPKICLPDMAFLALAGGVGGARMAHGLSMALPAEDLLIAGNIGDDFTHLGLRICPDLDTIMYTLAGLANPETGWGVRDETWNMVRAIEALGGPTWFRLGDKDLATHLERTRRLTAGEPLSGVTEALCQKLGVRHRLIPVSDTPVPTIVETSEGDMTFQDYFVKRQCEPLVTGFRFDQATASVLSAPLRGAIDNNEIDCVIICPSNPYVSIDPILAIPGMRDFLNTNVPILVISPIVGGKAIKGPAAKMMSELGVSPSVKGIARHYLGITDGIVIDIADEAYGDALRSSGMQVLVTDTVMRSDELKKSLAEETLSFARRLRG